MQISNAIWLICAGLFIMVLAGCATLSKESCEKGDWYGIGYNDGTEGHPQGRLLNHRKACIEFNISPDENDYQQGRSDGLKIYCTDRNGYDEGEDVERYEGTCPKELEQEFLTGYLMGLEAAENKVNQKISKINRDIFANTLLLNQLKNEKYKDQVKKIEQLYREIESEERNLSKIYDFKKRYGLQIKTP